MVDACSVKTNEVEKIVESTISYEIYLMDCHNEYSEYSGTPSTSYVEVELY